jgi:hypothetical protein
MNISSAQEETMLSFSRTASIAPGKAGDAIVFGQLIAKYIKETYGTTIDDRRDDADRRQSEPDFLARAL